MTGTLTLFDEEAFNQSHPGAPTQVIDLSGFALNQVHALKDFRNQAESLRWTIEAGYIVVLGEEEQTGKHKQFPCWGTGECAHLSEYQLGNALKNFRIAKAE